ncbi:MAG: crossover junction endodeoxyribonuclease RuvC [Rhodobacteraceae bacterium]|nr:crossover junction endodeoxyribonuclease RuvC [Paracoccaceae bacterium]
MRVLGIDPGLRFMGWGVITVRGNVLGHVANGVCEGRGTEMGLRLHSLFAQLEEVIAAHMPDCAAIEQTFVNRDAAGSLKLGQARGVALLALARAGLQTAEYAPNAIKKTVVGTGHAAKEQIAHMVRLQFPGVALAGPDAADAMAIAMTHAFHARNGARLAEALARAEGPRP